MEYIKDFFIENFALFCLSIIMIIHSVVKYKQHPRLSFYSILIVSTAIFLAVLTKVQLYVEDDLLSVPLTTIFGYLGYVIRPICIYMFILMSYPLKDKRMRYLLGVPLVINAIIYALAFIPATKNLVFFYHENDHGGISFGGGPLRFTSHIISALYFVLLLYIAFTLLRNKHLSHGFTILICSIFVVLSVIIETFFNDDGDIFVLNITIVIGCVIYYMYLYIETIQIDILTGLYNRDTYYHDLPKMEKSITAIIQFDMDGLKYLNDNFGHNEGDKALSVVAKILDTNATRNMYIYRLGGDEFILIANNTSEDVIKETVIKFKEELNKTPYHCSVGYAYRHDKNTPISDLIKESEKSMYDDKSAFYRNSPFERRKS